MEGFYPTVSSRDDAIFLSVFTLLRGPSNRILDYNSFLINKEAFCPLWKKNTGRKSQLCQIEYLITLEKRIL